MLARPDGVQGRDGGTSARAFGRSVWSYGDTVLDEADAHGTNWHTNSYDLRDPVDWRTSFDTPRDAVGAPVLLVPLTAEEEAWNAAHAAEDCPERPCGTRWALWPSEPLVDPADPDGPAWLLYGLYDDAHPSGIGVASWASADAPVVRHRTDDGWLLFPEPEPEWVYALTVSEGHVYGFGCPQRGLARPCGVARVPFADVDRRDAWRFWDGEGWSRDPDDAATLFDGATIMSVSWVPALDRWLLVDSGPFSHDVEARTAPALTGPWSSPTVLFTAPGEAPYDVVHHPELQEDDGAVQWITWSRPTEGWFGSEHVVWRVELGRP